MMKVILLRCLPLLALCAGCPLTREGPEGERQIILIDTEAEIEMGRGVAQSVAEQFELLEGGPQLAQVRAIGQRIVAASDPREGIEYNFNVIADDEYVNAFAAPGGWIYVSTGLMNFVESEDELAGVIAHEVSHVVARHVVQQFQARAVAIGAISLAADVLAPNGSSGDTGRYVAAGLELGANLAFLRYSRSQELQSDRLGLRYALLAGFDPRGLIGFLNRLAEMESPLPDIFVIFQTHPVSRLRVEEAREYLDGLREEFPGQWSSVVGGS